MSHGIAGYEVIRFGVPMIGTYSKRNREKDQLVTISPVVPGAQYRISAWALGNGSRSERPAVEYATTGETGEPCTATAAAPCSLYIHP